MQAMNLSQQQTQEQQRKQGEQQRKEEQRYKEEEKQQRRRSERRSRERERSPSPRSPSPPSARPKAPAPKSKSSYRRPKPEVFLYLAYTYFHSVLHCCSFLYKLIIFYLILSYMSLFMFRYNPSHYVVVVLTCNISTVLPVA